MVRVGSTERQSASCVVDGRFNPAILTPDWIVKQGILAEGQAEVRADPLGGVIEFRMAGLIWQPSLSRLEVYEAYGDGLEADPGSFVASILERLPHTPIRGVGNNFMVTFEEGDDRGSLYALMKCDLTGLLEAPAHEPLAQKGIVQVKHGSDAILSVTLEAEQGEVLSLGFNFHRNCASAVDGAEAARRWSDDREEARRLLDRIVDHARDGAHGRVGPTAR